MIALALKAKKQSERCLKDAANQDVQKEVSTVKKRLMKNYNGLLEIAVDVDKWLTFLEPFRPCSIDLMNSRAKPPRQLIRKMAMLFKPRQRNGERTNEASVKMSSLGERRQP